MKPATKMMSYQKSEDEETAVLLVPTILPTETTMMTTTMDRRSSKTRLAIVAGMILMVAGGTVLLQDGGTTAEGLIVATQGVPCEPATGTFGGVSTTTFFGKDNPFQTCYQYGDDKKYCWSNSTPRSTCNYYGCDTSWYECRPKPKHGEWDDVNPKYVVPYKTCGPACTDMYKGASF